MVLGVLVRPWWCSSSRVSTGVPGIQNGHHQDLQCAKQLFEHVVHTNPLVCPVLWKLWPEGKKKWWLTIKISYVFLGCSRQRDASASAKSFTLEAGNRLGQSDLGLLTPTSPFTNSPSISGSPSPMLEMPELVLGPSATQATQTIFEVGAPLSPFHYHLRKVGTFSFSFFFSFFLFVWSYWMEKTDGDTGMEGTLPWGKNPRAI